MFEYLDVIWNQGNQNALRENAEEASLAFDQPLVHVLAARPAVDNEER